MFDTDSGADNCQKLIGNQAGAADEAAVHARFSEERRGVIRVDAAAVLDHQRARRCLPEQLTEAAANAVMRLLSLLGRRMVR